MQLIKAIFSRKWMVVTGVVILGMAVMVRLGIWQLDRLEQRRAANAALLAVLASEPLQLNDWPLPEDLESLKDGEVVATGEFDLERQVVLVVQNWNGRAGVHLITPFLLDDETAVLVDRGWVPQADYDNGKLGQYDESGLVQLEGYVALSRPLPRNAQPEGPQREIYRVNVASLQEQLPYELLPFYVLQAPEGNTTPPFRAEPEIDLSEGPHLSYAIQWFLFTAILGGGYLIFVHKSLQSTADGKAIPAAADESV
jgi:surfeit locus 1 family protein